MPRIGRAVAAGFPHHVIQRGNNRENVFFDARDRKQYLLLLKKYSVKWELPIMAYCFMSNHVHILTKPKSEESLYKMMQGLTLCYTQYINRTYQRTGRLWESRYCRSGEIFMGCSQICRAKSCTREYGGKGRGLSIFECACTCEWQ